MLAAKSGRFLFWIEGRAQQRESDRGDTVINLNGRTMFVSATAASGVVSSGTRLYFSQRGTRVMARYSGGRVARGWLVGRWIGEQLVFRYAQSEGGGTIHSGRSVCEVQQFEDGRTRIIENFTWTTREGSGTNVFDEVPVSR